MEDRVKAKEWFNNEKSHWGRNASKVINPWKKENKEIVEKFIDKFKEKYNQIAIKINLQKI